jgi:hypothetical protein
LDVKGGIHDLRSAPRWPTILTGDWISTLADS